MKPHTLCGCHMCWLAPFGVPLRRCGMQVEEDPDGEVPAEGRPAHLEPHRVLLQVGRHGRREVLSDLKYEGNASDASDMTIAMDVLYGHSLIWTDCVKADYVNLSAILQNVYK